LNYPTADEDTDPRFTGPQQNRRKITVSQAVTRINRAPNAVVKLGAFSGQNAAPITVQLPKEPPLLSD